MELVIENTSAEGVYVAGLFDAETITDESHKLSFYTEGQVGNVLTGDVVVQGDFTLLAGRLDLNGHRLTITGNLLQRGGILDIGGGELSVYGDYTLGNPGGDGRFEDTHAKLCMEEKAGRLSCGGNLVMAPQIKMDGCLKEGTIEMKGNLSCHCNGAKGAAILMDRNLMLRFVGEGRQEIAREGNGDVRLGTISLENNSADGVVILDDLTVRNPIKGNGKIDGTEGKTVGWGNGEAVPFARWSGSLKILSDMTLGGDLAVDGVLTVSRNLDVNGKHLTAESLDLKSGLTVSGGIVQVRKDALMTDFSGRLFMLQPEDAVQVTGSLKATAGYMTLSAGNLEVRGNVTLNGVSLNAGEGHKMTLSGKMTAQGTAYIQTVTVKEGVKLNTLVLTKPRDYYLFSREAEGMCAQLVDDVRDITPPSVPSGLSAENAGHTGAVLRWNASSDDTGVTGYDIYRNDRKIMSVSGTAYTDKGLDPGKVYTYYIIAKDAAFNTSCTSASVMIETPKDTEAPQAPGTPELAERMATSLKLTWDAAADNVKTAGYRIYRDGVEIGTTPRTEYFDAGLDVNSHYVYTVSAYDGSGNQSARSGEAEIYTQAVEIRDMVPASYTKVSGRSAVLQLSFDNAGSTSGYHVYIGYREPETESYTGIYDRIVGKGTAYRRQITVSAALETAGIKGEETEVMVRITDAGGYETEAHYTYYLDRSAPAKLKETGIEMKDGVAVISYAKGTDSDISGYYLYREGGGEARKLLADITDRDKTYYYDRTVRTGMHYVYYVAAYDEEGMVGELSDAMETVGTEDGCAPVIDSVEPAEGTLNGNAAITVTASDNKMLDKAVIEYYRKDTEAYCRLAECPFDGSSVSYGLDTKAYGSEVTQRFTVLDGAGNACEEAFVKTYAVDNEGPEKIQNFEAETVSTTVLMIWDAPADEDFSYFSIEEQQEGDTWREIARTREVTGYAEEGLTPDSVHVYRVRGYDIRGNSGEPSEPVSVTVGKDTIAPVTAWIAPAGGYFNKSIPLMARGYDNLSLAEMTVEYSTDRESWVLLSHAMIEGKKKEQTVSLDFDLAEIAEGDVYLRVYGKDAAGNEGSREQALLQCRVDRTAPASVDRLSATGESGFIHLAWNEPTDNDVAGYRIYRSPEGMDSFTCIAPDVATLGYYDREASYDMAYTYRITAFDYAGNESSYSNTASAQKLPDDEAPVVHSVIPEEGSWISGTVEASALVSDNDRVACVEFALKGQEDGTKHVVGTMETGNGSGTVTCRIDTEGYANGVYDLLVTAKDFAGNVSRVYKTVCHISNVAMEKPVLSAVAGNWCAELHYKGPEDADYILYKKRLDGEQYDVLVAGKGILAYRDNEVDPYHTYVYQIMLRDRAGNTAYSVLSYVKPKPVDDRKPKAVILSDTTVAEGYETAFNGIDSTDNDRIKSYTWDFGDGSGPAYGPVPRHTFSEAGEYYVKLTVEDPSGNRGDTSAKITVLPRDSSGKAVVRVRNASGMPLKGVTVFVNASTEENHTNYTDQNGQTAIHERPGTYRIALYKPGYVAKEESVEIELHGDREYVFTLVQGETVTADLKVRQMTFQEMVEAGIDLKAPENQHVFTVRTKLTFVEAERPEMQEEETILIPAKGSVSGRSSGHVTGGSGGGGGGGGGISGVESEGEEEEFDDIYYHMSITQSVSWLKDMYEATLIVYNNAGSQTIVARDLAARLLIPSGISLAGTYQGQQAEKEVPDLRGGESGSVTWYLRGDAPGKYRISAALSGKLQPFDAALACSFESNEFEVTAGRGLVLTINPEDRAEKGETYYVYFILSNEGGKEFYNVKTTFGTQHNNSRQYVATADGTKHVPLMSAGDVVGIECLKPGESISGIYKTVVPVEGEKWRAYKKLVDYETEVLEGANLGVTVRISPVASHVPVPCLTYQKTDGENSEADPVNVSTGAYMDGISALSVQGVNPVSAELSYDSTVTAELGEFGYGWTHNYEARVLDMKDCTVRYYVSPTGYYTFLAADAEKAEYKADADGNLYLDETSIPKKQEYRCLNENRAGYTLNRKADGTYVIKDGSGTVTSFDAGGNLTSIANREGKKVAIKRDSGGFTVTDVVSGRKLSYTLNEDGMVSSVKDGNGREAKFYYDEKKCLKQFTNAMGESTYYTYDKEHRILTVADNDNNTYVTNTYKEYDTVLSASKKVTRVESQKDGLNHKTSFDYREDEASGDLVTTVTTRSGQKKKTVTDAYGNITCLTNEAGDETLMTYDGDGNETSVSNANGYDTVYRYDGGGNMTAIDNSLTDGSRAETVMTYDADGNMLTMKNINGESMECTYYENGLVRTVRDQNGNTAYYSYNEYGQVTEEKDSEGNTVEYGYDDKGDLVRVKDKNGGITEYAYNAAGLRTSVTVRDGAQTYQTRTFYDDLGRVDYAIDTEGGVTAYEYDCAGNVTSRIDPGGAMTVYAYDGNYQMVKETVYASGDGENVTSMTDYTYTKEGLLKTVRDGESGTVITNTYDRTGNRTGETETDAEGRKLSETLYEYDCVGNVTRETFVNVDPKEGEPESLSAEYGYYPNGKLHYAVDTAGKRTTYSYDRSWRVQTVVSDTEPSATYKYDPAGRVLSETSSGGDGESRTVSYTYDIHGNVETVTDPAGNRTTYSYDGNGNLTETRDATGRAFYSRYDALNRVREAGMRAPSAPETDIPLVSTSYDISAHTVTETDMVNKGSVTTQYDAAGRPVKTVDGGGNVLSETIYDTEGRILQTVDAKGMLTETVYDGLGQPVKVRTGRKGAASGGLYSFDGESRETEYGYDGLGRNTEVTDAEQGVSSVVFDGLGRIVSLKDPNQNRAGDRGTSTYEYTYNERGLWKKRKMLLAT